LSWLVACSREGPRPTALDRSEGEAPATTPAIEAPDPAPVERDPPPEPPRIADALDVELGPELRSHEAPSGAPSAIVHVPAGLAAERAGAVIFLHGWGGCARAIAYEGRVDCIPGTLAAYGFGLTVEHDRAGKNTILLVPQLRWLERRGDPGRFGEAGFFDAWLRGALAASIAEPLGIREPGALATITLVAHSAGYETLLAMLRAAPSEIDHVVLFDALYAGADELAAWVHGGEGRRVVSLYTGRRGTYRQNQRLATLLADLGDAVALEPEDLPAAIASRRVVITETRHGHGAIPSLETANVLRALPIAPRD
jgi:pimeloyl-ACP methyl ester carboxylesterase